MLLNILCKSYATNIYFDNYLMLQYYYGCFYAQIFEEELVKDLFNYQAANLEAMDEKLYY